MARDNVLCSLVLKTPCSLRLGRRVAVRLNKGSEREAAHAGIKRLSGGETWCVSSCSL